ncbi:hypothetical protein EMIHUDRAFT_209706 [Emiliania huxleyi CCMP1516]|uniref:Uncharacterized protein n=2 Tax=Emiliania huxleyi TaxID=2903 RepID=A0A0D3J2L5_EMIH1|nr:hypothetical protein EMIHUDRAFT_209706 [Emiliania huxleyi CCMP1516]EOD17750.1 hypothetical protein EMIHUDRAFT_209706 [Emiliania huxleyi CCMP1516]|eukprot:XP_005770179.1 hypothetical protein EMIHUDRAFT_209706 [Emiliania huxleyi CCMP1516]
MLPEADALRDSLERTLASVPRRWFTFEHCELEVSFRLWHHVVYQRELRAGLLIANFLYLACAIAFTSWENLQHAAPGNQTSAEAPAARSGSSDPYELLKFGMEATIVVVLSLSFALSFAPCVSHRPQLFTAVVLLLVTGFVTVRSALNADGVFSAPALLIIIVCFGLGASLLRMMCQATLIVGALLNLLYGAFAIAQASDAPPGAGWFPVALCFSTLTCVIAARSLERAQRDLFLMQLAQTRADRASADRASARGSFQHHSLAGAAAPATSLVSPLLAAAAAAASDRAAAPAESTGADAYSTPLPPSSGVALHRAVLSSLHELLQLRGLTSGAHSLEAASLFRLHNETLNVWTELLPAAVFAGWAAEMLHAHEAAPLHDRYIVGAGLVCANVLRPLCSGLAHLLHCTSATGYIAWWSCDYISISLAILTTASVYGRFAFYCSTQLQVLFFASTLGLLSTSLVAVLVSGDSSPVLRNMAFLLFCVFSNGTRPAHHAPARADLAPGAAAGVPFIYELSLQYGHGPVHVAVPSPYIWYWSASMGTFVLGLLVKGSGLPERALQPAPLADLLFTSHQLWHCLVNLAFALGTFRAWDVYLSWRPECIDPDS